MRAFEEVWRELSSQLRQGMVIRNWTVFHGYTGNPMIIREVHPDRVKVDPQGRAGDQTIPKQEFEDIWNVWEGYKARKVLREELSPLSRHSKYIISILHWYEVEVLKKDELASHH